MSCLLILIFCNFFYLIFFFSKTKYICLLFTKEFLLLKICTGSIKRVYIFSCINIADLH